MYDWNAERVYYGVSSVLSRRHSPNSMPQCVYGHALATIHEGPVEEVHLITVCLMPLLDLFPSVERKKPSKKISYKEKEKKPLCTINMLTIDLLSADNTQE